VALGNYPALQVGSEEAEVAADLEVGESAVADGLVDPARPDREQGCGVAHVE
jgi:hypothetical protein